MQRFIEGLCRSLLFKSSTKFFAMEGSTRMILRSRTLAKTDSETIEEKIKPKKKVKAENKIKKELVETENKIKKEPVITENKLKKEPVETENAIKKEPVETKIKIKKESVITENKVKKEIVETEIKKEPVITENKIKIEPVETKNKIKKEHVETEIKKELVITENKIKKEPVITGNKIKKESVKTVVKKEIKSEYFENQELVKCEVHSESSNNTAKKRNAITITEDGCSVKPTKAIKKEPENVLDIEDGVWRPENWKEVLNNILKMRKLYVAPVDSLGCEECPEKGVPPEVFRYQTLISVMLSSQTRDEVTHAASQRLIEHGLTVDNILSTPDEKIGELIYPAGFWKSKIKFIKNTSQILKDKYSSDIPRTYKELIKLPGVGPKMANIVMSVAWNDTVGIAVDTHVHRISNRLGWVPKPTKDPEQTRKALESWLPKDDWQHINVTLVGFGQTICKPVGPSCDVCLNKDLCSFGRNVLSTKSEKKKRSET